MRKKWQLGSFNLMDRDTNAAALGDFYKAIRLAGGDPEALRAEIGPVRFGDRMREWFGKGDTLNQSGRINIGNGLILESLRDLADFNNPNAGPGGGGGIGGGGGNGGGLVGQPLGGPPGGGIGSGGGGGGGGLSGFLGFLEQQHRDRFAGGFGLPPEILDAQRARLQGAAGVREAQGQNALANRMNVTGNLGGGRQALMGRDLSTAITENLLNQLTGLEADASRLFLQDRSDAFGQGNQFAGILSQDALGRMGINMQGRLGMGDLALRRYLGDQGFGLEQQRINNQASQFGQQFGLAQNNQMFNQGLSTFLQNLGML
jgi:hypothetical protein